MNTMMSKIAPRMGDRMAEMQMGRQQREEAPHAREGTLYEPGESGRTRGRGDENATPRKDAKRSNTRPSSS